MLTSEFFIGERDRKEENLRRDSQKSLRKGEEDLRNGQKKGQPLNTKGKYNAH